MMKKPIQPQDKYVLRLPDGLRERIKTHADRHDRSMNTEIVRVLEQAFPEPLLLNQQINRMLGMLAMLKEASAGETVEALSDALLETVEGIASGRVRDVDPRMREKVREALTEWEIGEARENEYRATADLDDEEITSLARSGRIEKF